MGAFPSLISQTFPPKSIWSVEEIPDLSGKVMMVTGGYTGIGKETVKALLARNAKVYIAGRNEEKAKTAIDDLKAQTGHQALFVNVDLADLKAIKRGAEDFLSKEKELHVLFNSGGVMFPPVAQLTHDGYDQQFGTNVLGHFYLTTLLLPALLAGAKTSSDGKARVINTSSSAGEFAPPTDFMTFKDSPKRRKLTTEQLYSQSKYGNVLFSNELAHRFGGQGIVSCALNPGNLRTELTRHMSGVKLFLVNCIQYPIPLGALTQLWAGTSPDGAGFNGQYLWPWARLGKNRAVNDQLQAELWKWCEEQVQGH